MKVLNFGSLNLDYVYRVAHFVQPGETLSALEQTVHPGGAISAAWFSRDLLQFCGGVL